MTAVSGLFSSCATPATSCPTPASLSFCTSWLCARCKLSRFCLESLSNRASDLSALLDQIGQAQQTLNATNQGLTSLTALLQSALSTAKHAQQAAEPVLGKDTSTLSGSATAGAAP